MRPLSFFVCYLLLWGCSPSADTPPPDTPGPVPPASAPAPAAESSAEIVIEDVLAENPLIVTGRARTFENNVVVRLLDVRGELIRETFTTSAGEMGQHNPFRAEVFVTRMPGRRITVQALEYSARDGSERSLVSRTVDYGVEPIEVMLHLPEKSPTDCSQVLPQRHELPKSVAMARLLVEALIAVRGSPFPPGSAVLSVNLREGVVTVDFNDRLQNVGGSCAAQAIRAAVEKTLLALPTVQRVVIRAGGSERLALQP